MNLTYRTKRLIACAIAGWISGAALAAATLPAHAAEPAAKPVEVMVVGTFHMANPGADISNAKFEDVLSPKQQAGVVKTVDALAKFKPTRIAVEWPQKVTAERYAQYQQDGLKGHRSERNEVVQLGYRLAKQTGAAIEGVDVDGQFPYGPVMAYAEAHGQKPMLDAHRAKTDAEMKAREALFAKGGTSAVLRQMNTPAAIKADHDFYRQIGLIGGGDDQPGAALLTGWYERNFKICARMLQSAKPGDRIVVIYGAGHAHLLRQCVSETPGFKLVEPNAWLPK
ncbi:DUF5694 domain-containing protein [Caulobacter segnis]|uniref:DUF5694 domain-containing protein n=1 Tax=Caulobacter segnis TaxID=88688 RepID=UPI00240F0242|nr:DUF5694 domain-containing protein [Caulobacter segnis]MDG2522820.1 DUF5694 domain-containing protein [Caulobacter segnis]